MWVSIKMNSFGLVRIKTQQDSFIPSPPQNTLLSSFAYCVKLAPLGRSFQTKGMMENHTLDEMILCLNTSFASLPLSK